MFALCKVGIVIGMGGDVPNHNSPTLKVLCGAHLCNAEIVKFAGLNTLSFLSCFAFATVGLLLAISAAIHFHDKLTLSVFTYLSSMFIAVLHQGSCMIACGIAHTTRKSALSCMLLQMLCAQVMFKAVLSRVLFCAILQWTLELLSLLQCVCTC